MAMMGSKVKENDGSENKRIRVKLKEMFHFKLTKMKKSDIPIYHSANWMNSVMKIDNFHHVEMNMIQLDIMLLFNLFLFPLPILSPSFPKDI